MEGGIEQGGMEMVVVKLVGDLGRRKELTEGFPRTEPDLGKALKRGAVVEAEVGELSIEGGFIEKEGTAGLDEGRKFERGGEFGGRSGRGS